MTSDNDAPRSTTSEPRLMFIGEVATLLRLSPDVVRRYTRKGLLPAYRISRKAVRYERSVVESFLASCRTA